MRYQITAFGNERIALNVRGARSLRVNEINSRNYQNGYSILLFHNKCSARYLKYLNSVFNKEFLLPNLKK